MEQEIASTICPFCQGEGGHLGECFRCSGTGLRLVEGSEVSCRICNGTGKCVHRCRYCRGRGILRAGDQIDLEPEPHHYRCEFCYLNIKHDKSRTSFTITGTSAEEVEMVARSIMAQVKLQEIQPLSKTPNETNTRNELSASNAIKIFFSYAHNDEGFLNKLKKHLKPLQQHGVIDVWHDRDISAGSEWERVISEHLDTAQIILLLISPDFVNSNYCYSVEMKRALERHERGEAYVIPIILRPVLWQLTPISQLKALPTDGKPITDPSWITQDRAFHYVAEGIHKVIEQSTRKPSSGIRVSQSILSNTRISNFEIGHHFCYCNKCKKKTEMRIVQKVSTKNGKPALRGVCSICGTNVYLILSKQKETES